MSEPVRIVICVEGGCVRCVRTLGVPVEYLLIDYDAEGETGPNIVPVAYDGEEAPAWVHTQPCAAVAPSDLPTVEGLWERFPYDVEGRPT